VIVGHYAAALIPRSRLRDRPFWILLVAANVPEFLWLLLALLGIEAPQPDSVADASFEHLAVQMTYSHNLVPGVIQGLVVGAVVFAWRRDRALALWCAALTVFHVLSDYVVGFEHQWLGPGSAAIGLNTYGRAPDLALSIELAFAVACAYAYQRRERRDGRPLPRARLAALYAVFVAGVVMWWPVAHVPLSHYLAAR
jgi:hypothetical protein